MHRWEHMARAAPPVTQLQLATLVDTPPERPQWLHEQKFDGYRMLADKRGAEVRLLSRRFKDWLPQFPSIAAAIAKLPCKRAVLDGEVCVVMPDGRTSFQALQNALSGRRAQLVYFAFDLLLLEDERVMTLGSIKLSDHILGSGARLFALACQRGLEGIISKRRDKPYQPGRGGAWLKTKCLLRQELVIGGFTEPAGSRSGFGSLLLGHYEHGKLVYAGKVGTGFSMIQGLRADKLPRDVVRERPAEV